MVNYSKDKKKLLTINAFMNLAFCFFNIFFNIYVYDMSHNFNIIIGHTITYVLTLWVVFSIIRKFLTQKVITFLYKLSFVLCLACVGLTFLISKDHIYLAFIIQFLYGCTCLFYYMPSEIAAMYKNDRDQMQKFNGLNTSVALISAIISPLISGYVIDHISYYVLFSVIVLCVIVSLIIARNINLTNYEVEHCRVREFARLMKENKEIKYGYIGHSIKRFANDGPIEKILYILLFLKTGTNYNVGIYSALVALIGGIFLILYIYCFKNSKVIFWLCTIFQFLAALLVILSNSVVCFFIYYFVKNIATKVIKNESVSNVLTMINHTRLANNKVEHYYMTNSFNTVGQLSACCLALIVYNCFHNVTAMTIFVVVVASTQIISTMFIRKSQKIIGEKKKTPLQVL